MPWVGQVSLPDGVDLADLADSVRAAVTGNEFRGVRWVIEQPEVRGAVLASPGGLARALVPGRHRGWS